MINFESFPSFLLPSSSLLSSALVVDLLEIH